MNGFFVGSRRFLRDSHCAGLGATECAAVGGGSHP